MPKFVLKYHQLIPNKLLYFGIFLCIVMAKIDILAADSIECGTVNLFRELIIGGNETLRDEWPFIVALYHSTQLRYFCGGTIVSHKHVLTGLFPSSFTLINKTFQQESITAAHCIQGKFSHNKLSPGNITVRLGAYNLAEQNESGVVNRNVTQIYVHPDWNVNEEKYDADIAILVLSDNVTFSNHIRPICMPPDDVGLDGIKGKVVGWGVAENGNAEGIPRQIETSALNDSYCYRKDIGIASYTSERSFCGGLSVGAPNKGDSGGGFFAIFGSKWVQYGTVSVVRANATGHIVTNSIAVYMNLKSFRNWIADTVKESGGEVSEATMNINLHCSYSYDSDGFYGCWLQDLDIRRESFVVSSITGSHLSDKTNEDVELIVFETGRMFFVPGKIGNFFQNLKYLTFGGDRSMVLGTKHIKRSNFEYMQHLEDLRFFDNDIEEIDEDSLWDLMNLQAFRFYKNRLKALHATTFSRNNNLTTVQVLSSALRFLPGKLFQNNSLLGIVTFDGNLLESIDEGMFETNTKLRNISFRRNRLDMLSQNLLKNNSNLRSVDFSHNAIKSIDVKTFLTNSELQMLSLASNKIEFLPANLFETNVLLEVINFAENSIKTIDEQFFERTERVREIYLASNLLDVIPGMLFRNNSQLRVVDLVKNSITTVDEKLFETNTLLRKISLASNRLDHFPRNLFKHNALLEFVNIRGNFFETLNERQFETNELLKEVYFENNYVEIIPQQLFQNNFFLEIVDFGNNSLELIHEQTFRANVKLREVYLQGNVLESLPTNVFRNNLLLQVVNLANNFFRTIDENIFKTNVRLRKVSFESNQFESLPRNLFQSNLLLQHIDFRDNSLKIIEITFTVFGQVSYINFGRNTCIDAVFLNAEGKFRNKFSDLAKFQDQIMANCTLSSNGTLNQ